MWDRASATVAGRLATALVAVNVEDAATFHDHHDARLDQRNGGLAAMPCGVDQSFDLGRRQ
jgi:hypothetical protein